MKNILVFSCLCMLAIQSSYATLTNEPTASVFTTSPLDTRYGLLNGLDHRSWYSEGNFPEPFLVDDSGLEINEARLDWLYTQTGSQHSDIASAEVEKGFGLATLELRGSYERDASPDQTSQGIGNMEVSGFFIKMLTNQKIWKKWASGDKTKAGDWAPIPTPPIITEVVPSLQHTPVDWRYTTEQPAGNWTKPEFDASNWKEGLAGFGTVGTPVAVVRTPWNTDDIWIRRTFTMAAGDFKNLQFYVFHDEDVEIYVNGVLAATQGGFATSYEPLEIRLEALALLKPGTAVAKRKAPKAVGSSEKLCENSFLDHPTSVCSFRQNAS